MSYQCLISFLSPTTAERAARLLKANGFQAWRIRLPQDLSGEGCAAGVAARSADREGPRRILEDGHIPYRKYYASEERDGL